MHVNASQEAARQQPAAPRGLTRDEEISSVLLKLQEVPERLQKTKTLRVDRLIEHINIMSMHLEVAKISTGRKEDLLSKYNEMATKLREGAVGVLELIVGPQFFTSDVLEAALLPRENKEGEALISMQHVKDTWQRFVTTDNIESLPKGIRN